MTKNFDEELTDEEQEEKVRTWKIKVQPIMISLQAMFYVTAIMLFIKLLFKL